MKKLLLVIASLLLVFTLSACNNDKNDSENLIYVTVYPMQFLVEQIASDTVEIRRVPGSTVHSESYEWSIKEQISMYDSDLLFYINGGVDNYIPNNTHVFEDGNVQLIDMSEHITYNNVCYTHSHDEEETTEASTETCDDTALSPDPHFWLDPVRMLTAAEYVKDKLIATYPENQELYNNNFTQLSALLQQLNRDFEEMAAEATKPIITSVMLFSYWTDRYDIEILPVVYDAHSAGTDTGDYIELLSHAAEDNIKYVLFEKYVNSPSAETVLDSIDDSIKAYLHGLGNITSEEMENGSNYITIMYENLEVLDLATK